MRQDEDAKDEPKTREGDKRQFAINEIIDHGQKLLKFPELRISEGEQQS